VTRGCGRALGGAAVWGLGHTSGRGDAANSAATRPVIEAGRMCERSGAARPVPVAGQHRCGPGRPGAAGVCGADGACGAPGPGQARGGEPGGAM